MKVVTNAKTLPKIYYGLHMAEGVAEYAEPGQQMYRIYIGEETIKNMDPTFAGRPVFVRHVEQVDLDNIQNEADGWVIESFFNKADGKHWVKFIVVSDSGHEAIRSGWKLSNAYIPKEVRGGGLWHGVEYGKEVVRGEYEHLAIVPNPRYEESEILTPEEFKLYNSEKEQELVRLANSKGDKPMKFSFFKKSKVENSAELEETMVYLPRSKTEATVAQILNAHDEAEAKKAEPQMANGDHHVQVGEAKMTVNELVAKHMAACNELAELKKPKEDKKEGEEAGEKQNDEGGDTLGSIIGFPKMNDEDEEAKKKALELAAHEEKEIEGKKKNAKEEKAEDKKEHFESLKNAPVKAVAQPEKPLELSGDLVARGKSRYGSNA